MTNGITRRSMLKRPAWFGADRRLVGVSAMLLGAVGFTMFRAFGFSYGLPILVPGSIWLAMIWVGRHMYRADPYMIEVLMAQFKYRRFYEPKSHLGVEHPQIKDFR